MVLKQQDSAKSDSSVWEWCKNVWYSNKERLFTPFIRFENDVKMYGTQTVWFWKNPRKQFENDVKMYGTQTMQNRTEQDKGLRMM